MGNRAAEFSSSMQSVQKFSKSGLNVSLYILKLTELHGRWRASLLDQLFRRDIWPDDSEVLWVLILREGGFIGRPKFVRPSGFSEAGIGTLLLAALKETAVQQNRRALGLDLS